MIDVYIEGRPRGKMAKELYEAVLLDDGINPVESVSRYTLRQGVIPIHFTVPDDVNPAAEFYCEDKFPFVMGTTGGNREVLEQTIRNSSISAVIDINMAREVVGLRNLLRDYGIASPDGFKGYSLDIVESHPSSKRDMSGTALSMESYFHKLGIPDEKINIKPIRDREIQLKMGIPKESLDSHAWHEYFLRGEGGKGVKLFETKLNDCSEYVKGTIAAIKFLDEKIKEGSRGEVFTMLDVYGFNQAVSSEAP